MAVLQGITDIQGKVKTLSDVRIWIDFATVGDTTVEVPTGGLKTIIGASFEPVTADGSTVYLNEIGNIATYTSIPGNDDSKAIEVDADGFVTVARIGAVGRQAGWMHLHGFG